MINELHIFGKLYTVKESPDCGLDPRLQGAINYQKATITIGADLAEGVKQETVLHEIVHGIEHEMQLELTEKQVGALSVGIWAFVQANPEQAQWIFGLPGPHPEGH